MNQELMGGDVKPDQHVVALVETYNGEYFPSGPAPEYGEPIAPITIAHHHDCLRLFLGEAVPPRRPSSVPGILIERRHDRWAVMIFPYADGDIDIIAHIPMTKTERKVLVQSDHHGQSPLVIDKTELVPEDQFDWRPDAGI